MTGPAGPDELFTEKNDVNDDVKDELNVKQNLDSELTKLSEIKIEKTLKIINKTIDKYTTGGAFNTPKISICFNAIVRNEEKIMIRRLENIRPYIDAICIMDTGSKDKTIQIINDFGKKYNIPTKVDEMEWVNFSECRTQAIRKAELFLKNIPGQWYLMFGDADDLNFGGDPNYVQTLPEDKRPLMPKFDKTTFDKDIYEGNMVSGRSNYPYNWMVKICPENHWVWKTPVHEYVCESKGRDVSKGVIKGGYVESRREGSRSSDPQKYLKDALMFHQELKKPDCDRERCTFYLAQSYRDCGEFDSAYIYYEKRSNMIGYNEEIYRSIIEMFKIRRMKENKVDEKCLELLYRSIAINPDRLEGVTELISYYNNKPLYDYYVDTEHKKLNSVKDRNLDEINKIINSNIPNKIIEIQKLGSMYENFKNLKNVENVRMYNLSWVLAQSFLNKRLQSGFLFADSNIYSSVFYIVSAIAAANTGHGKEAIILLEMALLDEYMDQYVRNHWTNVLKDLKSKIK